jgi:aconitate hydratase
VRCLIKHKDGTNNEISLNHSYNKSQIEWFNAGSALNVLKNK